MVKQYETVFIATPVLSEEQMKETVKKYVDLLTSKGAEIVYENNWGMRKLAYPIRKKTTGFYYLIEFKAEGSVINDLEVAYKRDERLLRFLTVSLDKHAVAYNEKKRAKKAEAAAVKEFRPGRTISDVAAAVEKYQEWQDNVIGQVFNPDILKSYLYNAGCTFVVFEEGSEFNSGNVEYTPILESQRCKGTITTEVVDPDSYAGSDEDDSDDDE